MSKLAKALTAAAGNAGESLYVEDVFSTYLYTGTASAITVNNGIDLSGEGGLTWLKSRSLAEAHILMDTTRGVSSALVSSNSNAAFTLTDGITAFNSNGFTLGTSNITNTNASTNVSWTFRKAEKFFDVVTYTGNSVNGRQLPHNLGSTPGMVVCKRTDTGQNWILQHRSLDLSGNKTMYLNSTNPLAVANDYWNSTHASDTAITLSGDADINGTGGTYVAYVFAHNAGGFGDDGSENIISCGSYTGNGSADGPTINCGFEPQWLLIKNTSDGGNWVLMDAMRGMPVGDEATVLLPNTNGDESGYANLWGVDLQATGFKVNVSQIQINQSGGTMVYIAIRRPMKTPESGTEVFAPAQAGGTGVEPQYPTSFPVDMAIRLYTPGLASMPRLASRLTGARYLKTSSSDAEVSDSNSTWDYMDGWFGSDTTAADNYGLMFKRATGFFDVVAYTGTGAVRTIPHNLGVAPEMMLFKIRNQVSNWQVYASGMGPTKSNRLNNNGAPVTATAFFNDTAPTSSVFTVGTSGNVNWSGNTVIAYLFATLAGVSKVGSYTGTGSNVDVDCGFSAGARFILIKRTDSTGDWYVWDSVRGIVAGNDPYLLLNSTAAEVTNTDYIDPLSSGFTVTSSAPAALNASGGTYIFLAIS